MSATKIVFGPKKVCARRDGRGQLYVPAAVAKKVVGKQVLVILKVID